MRNKLPGHATVVAYLALFIALGGSSYAAIQLGRNSVRAKNIARGAVRSRAVKNHSLLALDFAAGQLPAGVKGDTGEKGDKGEPGTPGTAGTSGAPGTARAYARVTGCGSGPCEMSQNKGIDYAIEVATGVYCVGVRGITPDDSVAIVSVAERSLGGGVVEWRRPNSACVGTEFEINTWLHLQDAARNSDNSGIVAVAAPGSPTGTLDFAIAVP